MKIVEKISVAELKKMAEKMFGNIVKADIDVEKSIVILDMPMHYDGELKLLENGSKQKHIWGINLHPKSYGSDEFIEFDSLINIRPSEKNLSRDVTDESIRKKIKQIIDGIVYE